MAPFQAGAVLSFATDIWTVRRVDQQVIERSKPEVIVVDAREQGAYVIQLIAERFSPFATVGGPLFAGEVKFEARPGNLYLTQTRAWLFLGKDYDDVHTLTDEQVTEIASPLVIIRRLLRSMTTSIADFQTHLDRIETKSSDVTGLLGFYLSDSTATVVDAIALHQFNN